MSKDHSSPSPEIQHGSLRPAPSYTSGTVAPRKAQRLTEYTGHADNTVARGKHCSAVENTVAAWKLEASLSLAS